jgi:hypothetical protein
MDRYQTQFEIIYAQTIHTGIIRPLQKGWVTSYLVTLKGAGNEAKPDILFNPSASLMKDWDTTCNGEEAVIHYDKALLDEIGEQIAVRLIKNAI